VNNQNLVALFNTVLAVGTLAFFVLVAVDIQRSADYQTQPAIQTTIVDVRGCDIIQLVQADKLIAAFPAPDQPKSCKVQQQTTTTSKTKAK